MARRKEYPKTVEAKCGNPECNNTGQQYLKSTHQRNNLWYCCPECKTRRYELTARGELPQELKKLQSRHTGENLKSRRDTYEQDRRAREIPGPTEYEKKLWGWDK